MWVWVSMVRTLLISSSENCSKAEALGIARRLSAAGAPPTQAPVERRGFGYKRSPASREPEPPHGRDRPCPQQTRTARRGRRLGARQWPLHGRPAVAEPGLCRLRALAACPCPRAGGPCRSGAQGQARAGGAHRRGHQGGRRRRHLAAPAGRRPRRRQDGDAVPPRARGRQGHACRRCGGDGGGGNARRGAGRRRAGRGRLRGIAGGGRPGSRR